MLHHPTMFLQILGLALAAGAVPIAANDVSANCAVPNIYVASYAGGVTSLQYTEGENELKTLGVNVDCSPKDTPSPIMWLELDKPNKLLYCSEETNGLVSSLQQGEGGALTGVAQVDIAFAAMSSILFGKDDNRALAVANYSPGEGGPDDGPGITILEAPKDGKLKRIQYVGIDLKDATGGNDSQEAPHPHQVLLDPTGNFILVPDLGSDRLRPYAIDLSNNNIKALEPIKTAPGSGPRHGIFWSPDGPTTSYKAGGALFYILLHEMANNLVTYSVTYSEDGKSITLKQVSEINTFGGAAAPEKAVASEVQISADNKFFYAANRLDKSFTVPAHFGNDTQVPSDSIAVFQPQQNGALAFVQLAAVGGVNPRHFSLNKAGNLLLAGFMTEGVVLLKRDPATGKLGEPVARTKAGEFLSITTSIFDE